VWASAARHQGSCAAWPCAQPVARASLPAGLPAPHLSTGGVSASTPCSRLHACRSPPSHASCAAAPALARPQGAGRTAGSGGGAAAPAAAGGGGAAVAGSWVPRWHAP
jgi:hypothetical protein